MIDKLNNRYRTISELGTGSFGVVYLGQDEQLNVKVAIKQLKMTRSVLLRKMPGFGREIEVMKKLRHVNIVAFIDEFQYKERVYIVSEYCSMGELSKYILDKSLTQEQLINVCRQMLDGIKYIHLEGFIHRDLKPENIFIAEGLVIKIGDYGLGKKYQQGVRNTRMVGTPLYTPPNILQGSEKYTQKCDVFSIGLIIYYLLLGTHVFEQATNIMHICEKQKELTRKNLAEFINTLECDKRFKPILQNSLAFEEQYRMTSSELRQLFQEQFPSEHKLQRSVEDGLDKIYIFINEAQQRFKEVNKYLDLARKLQQSTFTVVNKAKTSIVSVLSVDIYLLLLTKIITQCQKPQLNSGTYSVYWSEASGMTDIRDCFLSVLRKQREGLSRQRDILIKNVAIQVRKLKMDVPIKINLAMQESYDNIIKESWLQYRSLLINYLKSDCKIDRIKLSPQQEKISNCIKQIIS